ncbi:hypothetical protein ABGB07_14040 [Micromonosporaceae bacterium B7E4]
MTRWKYAYLHIHFPAEMETILAAGYLQQGSEVRILQGGSFLEIANETGADGWEIVDLAERIQGNHPYQQILEDAVPGRVQTPVTTWLLRLPID